MDPITTGFMAALDAGILDSNNQESKAAYKALKKALHKKFGADSDLADALAGLEKKPDSVGRLEVLREEMAAVKADQEPELLAAAQALQEQISRFYRTASQPLQRPPRAEPFIGRTAELAQLLNSLQPGQKIAVCGPGGIGKSALVAEAVWQLAPDDTPPQKFPDGIIYYNFRNQPRTDIALEHIARIFYESPKPSPYDAAERALANRQALLVIDGVDQADDLAGVLAVHGKSTVLLSSRQCQETRAKKLDLGPLPPDEATELLQAWGGWLAKEDSSNQRICELLDGIPLALKLAGHFMLKQTKSSLQYLAWLEKTPIVELDPIQRQEKSVSLLLEQSLAQVSETARTALAVAALLALAPFDPAIIEDTLTADSDPGLLSTIRKFFEQEANQEMPKVNLALRELVEYGLLQPVKKRHQISHPLIHAYARQHLPVPARATKRLASFFVSQIWEHSRTENDGFLLLEQDRPHLMRLLIECIEAEDWTAAYTLATAAEDYLDRRGYWTERVFANEAGLIAAWQLRRPSEGAWLGNLGDAYRTMGHTEWAIKHFEKALAFAQETGNKSSEANSLGNLGLAYRDLGQIEQAKSYLEQSLAIFERLKSPSADLVRDWLEELNEE